MVISNDILKYAQSFIGYKENDGSYKQIIDIYNRHKPLARDYMVKYTDNWCAVFVSACSIMSNATNIIPIECSCGKMIELFKKIGCWQENGNMIPRIGDIIFYDWDKKDDWPEHVGIVENVSGNMITVIEGNKSDAVGRRCIVVGDLSIRGYGMPKYDNLETVQSNMTNYAVRVNTPSGVNCRKVPEGDIITAYPNGMLLHITREMNGWGYANNTGWICLKYCSSVAQNQNETLGIYEVIADALVVRTGPGTIYARKAKKDLSLDAQKHCNRNGGLLKGTKVTVKEWLNGWARIPSGWVFGKYLKKFDI